MGSAVISFVRTHFQRVGPEFAIGSSDGDLFHFQGAATEGTIRSESSSSGHTFFNVARNDG